jgi:hypothetical protein
MELKYNKASVVPKTFYDYIRKKLSGLCAYRTENGVYYIKPLTSKYIPHLNTLLSKYI